jgi:hypothetical protein
LCVNNGFNHEASVSRGLPAFRGDGERGLYTCDNIGTENRFKQAVSGVRGSKFCFFLEPRKAFKSEKVLGGVGEFADFHSEWPPWSRFPLVGAQESGCACLLKLKKAFKLKLINFGGGISTLAVHGNILDVISRQKLELIRASARWV